MRAASRIRRWTNGAQLLTVAGFVVGASACCHCRPSNDITRPIAVVRFTCPGDHVVIEYVDPKTGSIVKSVTGLPVSEPITDIPEFHDCQRLVSNGAYDSLFAIFASFRLESLPARWQRDSNLAGIQGRPYGIVPAATIYSHGGEYPQLGIQPGFNCLFFSRRASSDPWEAKMVPWGGNADPDCSDFRHDPYTTGTPLEVRVGESSFGSMDYPGVARWDWDEKGQQQYIGITCGAQWCEVGKSGFQPSLPYKLPVLTWQAIAGVVPSPPSSSYTRVFKVKGWFDAQQLDTVAGSGMLPGPRGFLIPSPLLDSINDAGGLSAYQDNWSHVANAVVLGSYLKWNFTNGVNQIFFCYGSYDTAGCGVTDALPRVPGSSTLLSKCPADSTGLRWWAKIVSASGRTAYVCVERRDHSSELANYMSAHTNQVDIRIPGATRWRFLPNDPGGWIGCPTGCCTIKS